MVFFAAINSCHSVRLFPSYWSERWTHAFIVTLA